MSCAILFGETDDQILTHHRPRATGDKHRSWRTGSCEMLSYVASRGAKAAIANRLVRQLLGVTDMTICKDLVTGAVEQSNIFDSQVLRINHK